MTYQELADQINQKLQVIVGNADIMRIKLVGTDSDVERRLLRIHLAAMEIANLLRSVKEPK